MDGWVYLWKCGKDEVIYRETEEIEAIYTLSARKLLLNAQETLNYVRKSKSIKCYMEAPAEYLVLILANVFCMVHIGINRSISPLNCL